MKQIVCVEVHQLLQQFINCTHKCEVVSFCVVNQPMFAIGSRKKFALTIAPENTKAYYWLIRSYQKQHMDEMAAGELAAAKQKLPEDEYQKLLISLER